jgi:hypothetical protein
MQNRSLRSYSIIWSTEEDFQVSGLKGTAAATGATGGVGAYILDFIRLNDATRTARELYDKMLELYPDRANPGSLWSSAAAAKAET